MKVPGVGWKRLGAVVAAAALGFPDPAWAQARRAPAPAPDLTQAPATLPPTPPQGAWGEVVMADAKWMVVQNHQGQQFPIAADAVRQFLVRWPTTLGALTDQSVVEAVGPDLGSNVLQTPHIDVFEGDDRNLVTAKYQSLLPNNRPLTTLDPGFNRFMNAFDVGSQNLLYGWAFPVSPGDTGIPARLHVVGPVIGNDPVRVALPGNNFATIAPDGDLSVTQVTRGSTTFAEKGDLVFLMPTELTPRTVVLSQVVLYKRIPLRDFRGR